MANAVSASCRLCLITPADYDVAAFSPLLAAALDTGAVASLIIAAPAGDPARLGPAAAAFAPLAMAHGVAAIVAGDSRSAAYVRADGVHLDRRSEALAGALSGRERSGRMVGIGGLTSRHEALEAGERDPDYLFFGRTDGDTAPGIFPKALDLAAWWSSVTVIPAIVMGGRDPASVVEAAKSAIAFVALAAAVWEHPGGPAAGVREALAHLVPVQETAA